MVVVNGVTLAKNSQAYQLHQDKETGKLQAHMKELAKQAKYLETVYSTTKENESKERVK